LRIRFVAGSLARSYMFVLAGYTAALIGFPTVLAPGTVFDTAVSRVEEITIGVVCAAVVHSLIFPKLAHRRLRLAGVGSARGCPARCRAAGRLCRCGAVRRTIAPCLPTKIYKLPLVFEWRPQGRRRTEHAYAPDSRYGRFPEEACHPSARDLPGRRDRAQRRLENRPAADP